MFIRRGSKRTELTISPAEDKREIAEKMCCGTDSVCHFVPTIVRGQSLQRVNDMAQPLLVSAAQRTGPNSRHSGARPGRSWKRSATRVMLPVIAISCSIALWLMVRDDEEAAIATLSSRRPRNLQPVASIRCESYRQLEVHASRAECRTLLPSEFIEDDSWIVGIHIDRTPLNGANLRHRRRNRSLPHQYFVQVMQATLNTISIADPGTKVNLVVFSNRVWGNMVDETGQPIDWDITANSCDEMGLSCEQVSI